MVKPPCLSLMVNEKYESGISSSPYHLKEPVQVHDDKTLQLAQGHHSIELEKRGEINFIVEISNYNKRCDLCCRNLRVEW